VGVLQVLDVESATVSQVEECLPPLVSSILFVSRDHTNDRRISSPSGFLASTGVLAPLSEASPFAALLAPVDLEAAALTGPTIDAEDFQRLVYRPVRLPREGDAVVSIEIRIEEDLSSSRRLVTKSAVDVLVPNG
jgi:hypothetical protein